jgi:hypothetical protein
MACTITSLIMFAAFGVLAVGFTALPRKRECNAAVTSGQVIIKARPKFRPQGSSV